MIGRVGRAVASSSALRSTTKSFTNISTKVTVFKYIFLIGFDERNYFDYRINGYNGLFWI
jgi:hypothetical protein